MFATAASARTTAIASLLHQRSEVWEALLVDSQADVLPSAFRFAAVICSRVPRALDGDAFDTAWKRILSSCIGSGTGVMSRPCALDRDAQLGTRRRAGSSNHLPDPKQPRTVPQ